MTRRYFGLIYTILFLALAGYLSFPHQAKALIPCPGNSNQDFTDTCSEEDPPQPAPENPDIWSKKVTAGLFSDGQNSDKIRYFSFTFPENRGQIYDLHLDITRNDNPAPGVEFCVNNTSVFGQGYCRTAQAFGGGGGVSFRDYPNILSGGINSLDYTAYTVLVVKLSVNQTFFNENNVVTEWTMYRRELEDLTDTALLNPVITPGGSPIFKWKAVGPAPDRVMFMEGPEGQGTGWTDIPEDTDGWSPNYSFTTPGQYEFFLQMIGPARYGGSVTKTWSAFLTVASPPGPFTIGSVNCSNWPNPEVEVNTNSSSGANTYTLQRRTTGSWSSVASNLTFAQLDSYENSVSQNTTYEYRVIANNSSGSTTSSNTRNITTSGVNCGAVPSVTFSASPNSIAYNTASTLTWSSTDVTSCTASGNWSGSKAINGSQSTGNLTSSQTYTLTCSGPSGSASKSVTVNVSAPPAPTANISANPNPVSYGGASTISWSSTNSSSCSVPGIGSGLSGSGSTGGLISNTTYTTTCQGLNGSPVSASVTVTVTGPTVTISASPTSVAYGGSSTISWTVSNSGSCTASGSGWSGSKDSSTGTHSQSTGALTSNQTYAITCYGANGASSGPVSSSVTVTAPTADIKANNSDGPITLAWNTSANLSWTSTNAGSCNASGDWSGSKILNTPPTESTGNLTNPRTYNYTLTCSGNGSTPNTVQVILSAPTPNAPINVTVTQPDYCMSGPAATIGWTYSDPSGSSQSAYEVEMDEQGSFQSSEYDTGKVLSNSNSNFTGQGVLLFNKTYKTRVRVWNSYDQVSAWTVAPGNFDTPPYAYPQVDFSWTANGILNNPSPPLNKPVDFTDMTVFGGNPNGRQWSWTLGDGGTSTLQNPPSHTYTAEGSYYVTLTATDNANQVCVRTKGPLIIQKPIPKWREVAPR